MIGVQKKYWNRAKKQNNSKKKQNQKEDTKNKNNDHLLEIKLTNKLIKAMKPPELKSHLSIRGLSIQGIKRVDEKIDGSGCGCGQAERLKEQSNRKTKLSF
eukprot:UN13398